MTPPANETVPKGILTRHERTIDLAFAVLSLAILIYALVVWLGPLQVDAYRPRSTALLAFALVLQSIAAVVRTRSRSAFYALVLLSAASLAGAFGLQG